MIKVKEYINKFDGVPFYMAEATKIHKKATGNTKKNVLKNLKYAIECYLKENKRLATAK